MAEINLPTVLPSNGNEMIFPPGDMQDERGGNLLRNEVEMRSRLVVYINSQGDHDRLIR
jgi:hypothetical protein